MHVVIDIRALQTPTSRQRGIGYSLRGWLGAFLGMPYEHRVTLLVDPRFDPPDTDVPLSGEYWHTVAFESCPHRLRFPSSGAEHLARQSTEQFLLEQEADLFHMPSPFERVVAIGYPPTTCRSVVTFYDALPLLFPAESLAEGGETYAIAYHAKLRALNRCSRVVAISRSAADDLVRFTDVSADRIDVIHLAPSAEMLTRPSAEDARCSAHLRRIGGSYVFAQLGASPIKNAERLIAAFCQLPRRIKRRYKLVITHQMSEEYWRVVKSWLHKYRAGDSVVFTDWVPRDELRLLFANADLYVHPALYEGFGLPIVEAMALGTPVIVSNTGPMPEVVGDAALTFDPYDVDEITRTMSQVLSDVDLRVELGQRAGRRARQFTWEKAALALRQTYERALASPYPIGVPEPAGAWKAQEREAVAKLFAMADVADREYVVQLSVPGAGRWIAVIRYHMTTHVREAYFDPIVERQVAVNLQLAEAVRAAWQMLKDRAEAVLSARVEPRGSELSQEILESASRAAREFPLLNADLLAGPLPEFGEVLGREFYHKLHTASALSMPPVSESQKLANANMITDIHKLARRIEDKRLRIAAYYVDAMDSDVVLRDYQVRSEQRFVGPLIAWVRRNLTSHIREAYVDPILERQVTFNRLLVACLSNVNAINLLALAKMEAGADIMLRGYRVRSKVPVIGPLIAWARRNLTSHLREPYIDPIFERQVAFNRAAIDLLRAIHCKVTDWRLRESYNARVNSLCEIREEISRLKGQLSPSEDVNELVAEQAEFNSLLAQLIEQMRRRVEELS